MSGSEEETRISVYKGLAAEASAQLADTGAFHLRALLRHYADHCPLLVPPEGERPPTDYHVNGSRIYSDDRGVELATPECHEPVTQLTYTEANARLLTLAIRDYAAALSQKRGHPVTIVQQRRVIDSAGNTWGAHDSYSLTKAIGFGSERDRYRPGRELIKAHLLTRNTITGAGLLTDEGAFLSQKLTNSHGIEGYGFRPYLFRLDPEHGLRLELRCNDINLKPWASLARIGGSALVAAAAQTGLATRILRGQPTEFLVDDQSNNRLALDENYRPVDTAALRRTIQFQRLAIETILSDFHGYTGEPIPGPYVKIGKSILDYCDDVELVLNGEADVKLLADRADWAAKMVTIRSASRHRNGSFGVCDPPAQVIDLMYDRITTVATPKGEVTTVNGYGYELAGLQHFFGDKAIATAMLEPPSGTRAAKRVRTVRLALARDETIADLSWHRVYAQRPNGRSKSYFL